MGAVASDICVALFRGSTYYTIAYHFALERSTLDAPLLRSYVLFLLLLNIYCVNSVVVWCFKSKF